MCGIFAFSGKQETIESLKKNKNFQTIQHRGPDNTTIKDVTDNLICVFHRLAINGLDHLSDQPLCIKNISLICNGEIYNYRQLIKENDFNYQTNSDCEIIIHMYLKYGMEYTLKSLDGVFAFVLYDANLKKLYAARDPIGIRSLYYAVENEKSESETELDMNNIAFCSEGKSLTFMKHIYQFPPGKWLEDGKFQTYYSYSYNIIYDKGEEEICSNLKQLLTNAVDKRMMSDRRVCTLLSGGLDSTLVTALVKKHYPNYGLDTYAIGLEGSVDLYYARKAAEYMKTRHFEVIVTEQEFLNAIEKTIHQIESCCTTSVRASVGNYLVSLYIKSHDKHEDNDDYNFKESGDTVVFCGDLSDEIFASYRGFQKADTPNNFYQANLEMLKKVHMYDVLRSDKSISGAGLEARVPFADKAFVEYVMSIDPKLKMFNDKRMEKYLLRKAFADTDLLSDELLWRRKEAFSDGVSSQSRSWFQIIREFVDQQIPDDEYQERLAKYAHSRVKPYDKESLYYREIFDKYYPNQDGMIFDYWRHPFTTELDPSARLLDVY